MEMWFYLDERKVPVVAIVMEGGKKTFDSACEAVEANIPLLVFAGSGKAADFIAAAFDRREHPLVLQMLYFIYTFHF